MAERHGKTRGFSLFLYTCARGKSRMWARTYKKGRERPLPFSRFFLPCITFTTHSESTFFPVWDFDSFSLDGHESAKKMFFSFKTLLNSCRVCTPTTSSSPAIPASWGVRANGAEVEEENYSNNKRWEGGV